MKDLTIEGMAIAPGVVETIVCLAAAEVEGVASIGSPVNSGIRSVLGAKPSTQGVEVSVSENDALVISIRMDVYYGYVLPDLANAVRSAVADAVTSQIGLTIESIDIYIDGMQFAK